MKLRHLMVVFLIIVVIASLAYQPMRTYGAPGEYDDVGIGRREPIPGNLPWYPVIVFGDNRPDHAGTIEYNPVTYYMRDMFITLNPIAVIGVGDHVWNGYIDQIQHFIQTFRDVPNLWVVAGNHEWNNYPYVNSNNRAGVEYWREHVAPDLYYKDEIPGWRFVFINLRAGYEDWNSVQNWLVTEAFNTGRGLIVVFHEPVYPKQDASKSITTVQNKLIPLLDQYKPRIVLQGHIHCYYEGVKPNTRTLYIITGGGGAPKCSRYPFHFVYLLLKPDGTYKHFTVATAFDESATQKIGGITVSSVNQSNTTHIVIHYTVRNTLRNIYGGYISVPVRLTARIMGRIFNIVFMAGQGTSNVDLAASLETGELKVNIDARTYQAEYPPYIYDYSGDVWVSQNYSFDINLYPSPTTTTGSPTIPYTSTPTASHSPTTTTPTQTGTTTGTMAPNTSGKRNGSNNGWENYVDYILIAVAVGLTGLIAVEAILLMRKNHRV